MKHLIALITVTTAISAFTIGTQAQAGIGPELPSVSVKYSARELNSERGVASLYGKIEAAAESLCASYQFGHSPAQLHPFGQCVESILTATIKKVDQPQLNAYAAAHGVYLTLTAAHRRD